MTRTFVPIPLAHLGRVVHSVRTLVTVRDLTREKLRSRLSGALFILDEDELRDSIDVVRFRGALRKPCANMWCADRVDLHIEQIFRLGVTVGLVLCGDYVVHAVDQSLRIHTTILDPGSIFAWQHRLPHVATPLGEDPLCFIGAEVRSMQSARAFARRLKRTFQTTGDLT